MDIMTLVWLYISIYTVCGLVQHSFSFTMFSYESIETLQQNMVFFLSEIAELLQYSAILYTMLDILIICSTHTCLSSVFTDIYTRFLSYAKIHVGI